MVGDKVVCDKDGGRRRVRRRGDTESKPRTPHKDVGNEGGCQQVPRLLRETKVEVTKCHACHAKCRGVTGD